MFLRHEGLDFQAKIVFQNEKSECHCSNRHPQKVDYYIQEIQKTSMMGISRALLGTK